MVKIQCNKCDQFFKNNKSSYKHKCRPILKNFRAYDSLTQHIKSGKGSKNRKVYECLKCNKNEIRCPPNHQCSQVKSLSKQYINKKPIIHKSTAYSKKYDGISSHTKPPLSNKKIVYYCCDHEEQQVTYYCFSCWKTICPECVIHGVHKDHSVKMIKKVIIELKNDYMEKIEKLTSYQYSIAKDKDNLLRIIKSTNQRHVREKQIISKQFQTARAYLTSKQKQLLKQLDQDNHYNIQTLTHILQQVNKNYQQSNKLKKNIQSILKKDQVLVLQEYKKISDIQIIIKQLSLQMQGICDQINSLNRDEAQQLRENIQKIGLKLDEEKLVVREYLENYQQQVCGNMRCSSYNDGIGK